MSPSHPFWDEAYGEFTYRYGFEPNRFLVERAGAFKPGGRVLCIGDGEGRNGVWLAEQGFDVTSLDASEVGQRKARALADRRGVAMRTVQAMLPDDPLPEDAFDAVVLIYLHLPPAIRPVVHRMAAQALRPGGVLLLEGFTRDQLKYDSGGPKSPDMLFTADLLRSDFADLEIEVVEELELDLEEGHGHTGRAAVVRLLGRNGTLLSFGGKP